MFRLPPRSGAAARKLSGLGLLALSLSMLTLFTGAAPALAQPSVQSVVATTIEQVDVTWSEAVDPTTGGNPANYFIFETATPANTVSVDGVTVGGATTSLELGAELTPGTDYTLRTQNVQAQGGGPGSALETNTFDGGGGGGGTATPIADIQANPTAYENQTVTVEGQVYIPSNYRGSTISGYIQDSSGRGINVFGDGANVPALQDTGNVVQVTGTVEIYFTTIEIVDITEVTVVSSGNPPLTPQILSTGAAANSQWEGTFIQVTGPIVSQATGGPGINYTVNDGSGPIVVRVVDSLGVQNFSTGATITARGAGGQFQTDFQVNVGLSSDVFLGGGGNDTTPPTVSSASAGSATGVSVSFSEAIDATTGGNPGNYSVFQTVSPGNTVPVTAASVSGASASLTLGSDLADGVGYTVQVTGVEDLAGNAIAGSNSATFTYTASNATPIATIQANPAAYENQTVTVRGQVFVPSDYRGSTISGYIQDDSGRGINVFGDGADVAALRDTGNVVEVTGTVELYFTTTEIVDITNVTVISSGNPPLTPTTLSTGAAANSQWEGTFIQVSGPIVSQAVGGPGVNYTVNDGSGPIVVRVVDSLGAASFSNGTTITARGAGGQFQTDFQVNVGQASDVFEGGGGNDTTPPTVVGASAGSETAVTVNFSEGIDGTTGGNAGNYAVFQTAAPGNTVAVNAASASGTSASLTLGSALAEGVSYTVQVTGVEDPSGNVIAGNNSATFTWTGSNATSIATIQANPESFQGQTVTVEGQVYIPTDYRGDTTFSGYIQDSSGRGINVFGSQADVPALKDPGNIVRITGEIDLFFTTVEILNLTEVTLLSSGNPPLTPQELSIGAAASPQWEGTYIQVRGTITDKASAGGAFNYTLSDGTGTITARVDPDTGAPEYNVGQDVVAAGAGAQFQTTFQVTVGKATDFALDQGGVDTTPPTVVGANALGETQVSVNFNEVVDQTSGAVAGNYSVVEVANPGNSIGIASAIPSGVAVTLNLSAPLTEDVQYRVTVSNVEDLAGNVIAGGNSATFTRLAGGITPIAVIQADPASFQGQTVTVQGQVYIPTDYRGDGTNSGYIQDSSGRGINVFGNQAGDAALRDRTAIVRLTGEIDLFFTTVEILNLTEVVTVSTGNPELQPLVLSTGGANSADWEGTYIRVNGTIQAKSSAGGAFNYTLNDGTGSIIARVDPDSGAPEYNVGEEVWASGAGSRFGSDFQVTVGWASDFTNVEPPDLSPPALFGAFLVSPSEVQARFNEALDNTSASNVANYTFTGPGGATVEVVSAVHNGTSSNVDLFLADPISANDWTLTVTGVRDLDGNPIVVPQTVDVSPPPPTEAGLDGPPRTFLPREGEEYPVTMTVGANLLENGVRAEILLRVFDLQGRLERTLYDSRFAPDPVQDFRDNFTYTVEWDGRNDIGEFSSAGAYIVHLSVVDSSNGKRQEVQMPVVVASRLKR